VKIYGSISFNNTQYVSELQQLVSTWFYILLLYAVESFIDNSHTTSTIYDQCVPVLELSPYNIQELLFLNFIPALMNYGHHADHSPVSSAKAVND
jgi:hypothetical protein